MLSNRIVHGLAAVDTPDCPWMHSVCGQLGKCGAGVIAQSVDSAWHQRIGGLFHNRRATVVEPGHACEHARQVFAPQQ
jgi:hypothetical protein